MSEPPASQGAHQNLLPLGSLFSQSWTLYKSKFLTLFCIILIGFALAVGSLLLLAAAAFLTAGILPAQKSLAMGVFAVAVPFTVVYFICRFQLALVFAVVKEKCGVGEAINSSGKGVGSFFWLGLATAFVLFGGFLLFVIPGIIFAVRFFAAPYVFATEKERGLNCLLRSRSLVRGKWWSVAIRLLIVLILSALISAVPFIGPIAGIFFSPFPMIYAWTLFEQLRAAAPPAVSPQKGKAGLIFFSALGYVLPAVLMFFFAAMLFTKAEALFHKTFSPLKLSTNSKFSSNKGVSSAEDLLKAAAAAMKRKNADDFMKLCAFEGVTTEDAEQFKAKVQNLMATGIETSSLSWVDPASPKIQTETTIFGKFIYEPDRTIPTSLAAEGYLEFWLKNGKGAFVNIPFGKKAGRYYVAVNLRESKTLTVASTARQLLEKAKRKLKQASSLTRSIGLTHQIHLKNGRVMQCAIVKRDEEGLWVETAPGARAYFKNEEIVKITKLAETMQLNESAQLSQSEKPAYTATSRVAAPVSSAPQPSAVAGNPNESARFKRARTLMDKLAASAWDLNALSADYCNGEKSFSDFGESTKARFKMLAEAGGIKELRKAEEAPPPPGFRTSRVDFDIIFNGAANPPQSGHKAALISLEMDDKKDGSPCFGGYSVSTYSQS